MTQKTREWVNPYILKKIRENLNITREEVEKISKKLKKYHFEYISAKELKEWEEGRKIPELPHLETLAEIYKCPLGYFFMEEISEKRKPLSFRGLSEEKKISYTTQASLDEFLELANFTALLINRSNIKWDVKIKPKQIQTDYRLIEETAIKIRKFLNWNEDTRKKFQSEPQRVFEWWRDKIESLGIFCFELKLEPREVRGASLWLNSYPFILVNHQNFESYTGRLFTLIHEFIHLISQREGLLCDFRGVKKGRNPEPFANKLTARILISPDELKNYLKENNLLTYKDDWSDKVIDRIRTPFFVSRDVIAIMLEEMRLAPKNFYEKKLKKWENRTPWGRKGKRPTKIEQILRKFGKSFIKLLTSSYRKSPSSFPLIDVSYILNIKVEKISEFIELINM